MVLEFYYDLLSQPCRAVYLFLKAANIKFEAHKVSIGKGEHKQPEFLQLSPMGKVPIIRDGDFILTESVAILRYISQKYKAPEQWYPRTDVQKQARADEFLNWYHIGLRKPLVDLFVTSIKMKTDFGPFTKIDYDGEKLKELREVAKKALDNLDEGFLKGKKFILGDQISVCDLMGSAEIGQLIMRGEETYKANENVNAWLKRVSDTLEPHMAEVKGAFDTMKEFFASLK